MAGRPRGQGKREPNGRLSRVEQGDERDTVLLARRRRVSVEKAIRAGMDHERAYRLSAAISEPLTKEERRLLALAGDELHRLELLGDLEREQVTAGHDFAVRYLRYCQTNGIPRRTAKIAGYGAISGMPGEASDRAAIDARRAHLNDLSAVRHHAHAGAIDHLFRASVEGRKASVYLLRSALDALITYHSKKGRGSIR